MIIICGDRHWQYMSLDPDTSIREYSVGPSTNRHAKKYVDKKGMESDYPYMNATGGFFSATVERHARGNVTQPKLTLRFHGVNGQVHFEEEYPALFPPHVKDSSSNKRDSKDRGETDQRDSGELFGRIEKLKEATQQL
eukprot:CAMPEP_0183315674 /NCGR_PEP_ID=MMETSP0160_2-20130417/52533_1 /TAXON_ID=2839 ORGANISM="Odontella Sinensis, Strain Grunow 1884" /NCGR_SAMPLE_ID=MMETSP0160_2 /ASSEMBLY_ACC=CAM_ASM_000250 /LENGTH=137 /DNA_ID=CAMNT_0025481291 /DNA_START=176 /DNA_END=586 /DNA_ORIENTATION=-